MSDFEGSRWCQRVQHLLKTQTGTLAVDKKGRDKRGCVHIQFDDFTVTTIKTVSVEKRWQQCEPKENGGCVGDWVGSNSDCLSPECGHGRPNTVCCILRR